MRLTVEQALNILNSANIEGGGYTADNIKYGIVSGEMPVGFAIPGKKTEYYPEGKTTYVIESERLMKWKRGDDIRTTAPAFIELTNNIGDKFHIAVDKILTIQDGIIWIGTDEYLPVKETADEILRKIKNV